MLQMTRAFFDKGAEVMRKLSDTDGVASLMEKYATTQNPVSTDDEMIAQPRQ